MDMQTYGGPFGHFKEAEKVAQIQEDGAVPFDKSSSSFSLFSQGCDCGHGHSDIGGSSGSIKTSNRDKTVGKGDDDVADSEPRRHFRPRTTLNEFSNV